MHPPHHDGSRPERVHESDADRLAIGGEPRGDDLPVGERERDLEPGRATGEVLVALPRGDVPAVLLDASSKLAMLVPQPISDRLEAGPGRPCPGEAAARRSSKALTA
jgi:hypothetical protein